MAGLTVGPDAGEADLFDTAVDAISAWHLLQATFVWPPRAEVALE